MTEVTVEQAMEIARGHHQAGQYPQAEALCRQILQQQPTHAGAWHLLGILASMSGRRDLAVDMIRRAIALKPNDAEAYNNLGVVLKNLGRFEEAMAAGQLAIALRNNYPEAHYNLSNALQAQGRFPEAAAACRQAIAVKPDYAEAYGNLGVALQAQGQLAEASAAFRQAVALKPNYPDGHYNLGVALQAQGQFDAATAAFRQAIALNSKLAEAHNNLGVALLATGHLDAALAGYRRATALFPDNALIHSNLVYTLHFHPASDAQTLAEEHRRWARRHAEPLRNGIRPHTNDRNPERRLRLGCFSPRMCMLPEGRFLLPLLRALDHSRLEVVCYSDCRHPDRMTERIRQCADIWRDIAGWPNARVAERVRQDQIDIAVDLALHSSGNRLLVFARKPAPVQVSYLAYCSTTGISTMDYRLSDPYLDPPGGDESVYSERTMRLPETYWCYQPILAAPEAGPLPALARGHITFGCLNNFSKVSAPALAAWAKLLRAVPNAQLLLHAHEGAHRQQVRERLKSEGIDPQRVQFTHYLPLEKYFELYRRIDLALGTFPFAGGTTTCDALWMGVPVVSMVGRTAVGRGGLSILSNVGLPEMAAHSEAEYVRIAGDLAGDLPRLSGLRATLRQRMAQSPLMDAPRFARNMEAAYRQMWRQWCASAAGGISVPAAGASASG